MTDPKIITAHPRHLIDYINTIDTTDFDAETTAQLEAFRALDKKTQLQYAHAELDVAFNDDFAREMHNYIIDAISIAINIEKEDYHTDK